MVLVFGDAKGILLICYRYTESRSCTDQINTSRIITEQSLEYWSPFYLAFADFEKAFDRVQHEAIWQTMQSYKVPPKIIMKMIWCHEEQNSREKKGRIIQCTIYDRLEDLEFTNNICLLTHVFKDMSEKQKLRELY
ncbi:uncharacterized protein LOC126304631 [Schistocerca gregaria]|uniref:uncharacterized protein LOC126304631 n=1 Tax=Schistocerca gregaria TaxID=7010 RepID=UPI00211DD7AC|nr:uncharacterized protein LOC126304631 [Schistocerca gregaria]